MFLLCLDARIKRVSYLSMICSLNVLAAEKIKERTPHLVAYFFCEQILPKQLILLGYSLIHGMWEIGTKECAAFMFP